MPAQDDASSSGPSALEAAALPHAVRCWEAEVENARRLSTRVQVLLSLASALFGFLFLRGTPEAEVVSLEVCRVVALLVGTSGTLVLTAIAVLLRPRSRNRARPLASHSLAWPPEDVARLERLSAEAARSIAWARTIRAAAVLQRANAAKQEDVDRSQLLLLLAAAAGLLALLIQLAATSSGRGN